MRDGFEGEFLMRPVYATFPEAEHRQRLERAREALRWAGAEFAIAIAPENIFYLAGYDSWVSLNSLQALLFGLDGKPSLVVRDVDLPLALESSWVRDIRTYRLQAEHPAACIAHLAREKGLGKVILV